MTVTPFDYPDESSDIVDYPDESTDTAGFTVRGTKTFYPEKFSESLGMDS
jgi:hypothetical protein